MLLVDSACTGHILRKTKGTKNDNNTNAKQDQKYNTSQTIEDNEWFMDTGTCRKTQMFAYKDMLRWARVALSFYSNDVSIETWFP